MVVEIKGNTFEVSFNESKKDEDNFHIASTALL